LNLISTAPPFSSNFRPAGGGGSISLSFAYFGDEQPRNRRSDARRSTLFSIVKPMNSSMCWMFYLLTMLKLNLSKV
jgi:hypothetical protein